MMHHFFVSTDSIEPPIVRLSGEQARQIAHVLRMRPGDRLIVLDNAGWRYEVQLTAVDGKQVVGDIVQKAAATGEPSLSITLYMALIRREKFEWVLQKCTEIGVSAFVPVITQRTLWQANELRAGKQARWQKIVTEAAEQSRRGRIPSVSEPVRLGQALAEQTAVRAFMAWEEATAVGLTAVAIEPSATAVGLFIGPEGGFTADEVALASQYGVQTVTLGPRILRAETAAMVATTLLLQQTGDLG